MSIETDQPRVEHTTLGPAWSPPPRRASGLRAGVLGALVGAVLVLAVGLVIWAAGGFDDEQTPVAVPPLSSATTAATSTVAPPPTAAPSATLPGPVSPSDGPNLAAFDASDVGAAVVPSVVTVQVGTRSGDDLIPRASGSGVVFDQFGHIVTNEHVVSSGDAFDVVLSDGRVYEARLVGRDESTDLAVLHVTTEGLEAISRGTTDDLAVGDPAVAVGSPLGLEGGPSLTVGVVSAFGREVRTSVATTLYGMVQTDAPITQGSSGGALVDRSGNLIGITTAVGVSEVGIEGIGFATPIEIVQRVVAELISSGRATQPFLGITGATAFGDTGDDGRQPIGVEVASVEPDSAAAAAGLLIGDVITALDGRSIDTMDELIALLRRYSAGEEARLRLMRDGDTVIIETTLDERPPLVG